MPKGIRYFTASLFIGFILLGTLAGFVLVDMSSGKYMPELSGSLLEIGPIDSGGMSLTFLGRDYHASSEMLEAPVFQIFRFRGIFPADIPLTWQISLSLAEMAGEIYSGSEG